MFSSADQQRKAFCKRHGTWTRGAKCDLEAAGELWVSALSGCEETVDKGRGRTKRRRRRRRRQDRGRGEVGDIPLTVRLLKSRKTVRGERHIWLMGRMRGILAASRCEVRAAGSPPSSTVPWPLPKLAQLPRGPQAPLTSVFISCHLFSDLSKPSPLGNTTIVSQELRGHQNRSNS